MSKRFAVIGNPITHSLSPIIHQHFAQQTNIILSYERILGDEQHFENQVSDFFRQHGKGINVTLPFKQRAFALADYKTKRCELAGAANTLWFKEGKIHADNTDGIGLVRDLSRFLNLATQKVLILGAGGASRGIIQPLLDAQVATLVLTNRSMEKAAQLQLDFPQITIVDFDHIMGTFDLIINATSTSLSGLTLNLPDKLLAQKPFCYDLAYQLKGTTSFTHYARQNGCIAQDGLGMLVEQAAEAFYIWHDVKPDTKTVLSVLQNS